MQNNNNVILLVMPQFAEYVDTAVDALNQDPNAEFDENAFIDASRLVKGFLDIHLIQRSLFVCYLFIK